MTKFHELQGYFVGNQKQLMILMIAGVGVLREDHRYEFFSHHGDYIGSAPKTSVEHMIHVLRRRGIERSREYSNFYQGNPGITYINENLVHQNTVVRWIHYLFEYPIEIQWKPVNAKIKPADAAMRIVSWLRVAFVYSLWPTLVAMSRLQWDWRKWRHTNPCAEIKIVER